MHGRTLSVYSTRFLATMRQKKGSAPEPLSRLVEGVLHRFRVLYLRVDIFGGQRGAVCIQESGRLTRHGSVSEGAQERQDIAQAGVVGHEPEEIQKGDGPLVLFE